MMVQVLGKYYSELGPLGVVEFPRYKVPRVMQDF